MLRESYRFLLLAGLLILSVLVVSGAFFQDEMPEKILAVAECTDCHYREPTIEELDFAERTWQEAWGQMNDQELLDGVVLELEAYQ